MPTPYSPPKPFPLAPTLPPEPYKPFLPSLAFDVHLWLAWLESPRWVVDEALGCVDCCPEPCVLPSDCTLEEGKGLCPQKGLNIAVACLANYFGVME